MVKLRKINLTGNINPDLSVTPLGKSYEDKFNLFDEENGGDLGDYYDFELIEYGFTKAQLNNIKKSGDTTNFVIVRK